MDHVSDPAIQVLMVEDDDDDALLISSALYEFGAGRFNVLPAQRLSVALEGLKTSSIDVVLLDLFLPDSRGLESLMAIRRESADVPVVVLTGLADEQTAVESLHNGAQDYLVKGTSGGTLVRSIRHAIERQRLVTSVRSANKLLSEKNTRLVELCDTAHRFVDNVSHEFRTPLTVVKEFSSLLLDGLCGSLNHEQRRAVQVIADRSDDLTCMVNDMMDVSRLKAGILSMWRRPTPLADVMFHIRSMLERRAARGEVRLQIEQLDHLPLAFCDAGKVGQIITNLVVNSIKFTGAGGSVDVWAQVTDDARLTVGITDNGQGIEPDKLRLIFERFTQLNHDIASSTKGVGLGLAIVKEFVLLNLGEISVESAPGKGSTFTFTLPQANPLAVFDCFYSGLRKQSGNIEICLLNVKLTEESSLKAVPVVDEFLQRTVRPEDVVWSRTPGEWLILIIGSEDIAADAIDRIHSEWSCTCRNWIHGSPPSLTVQQCGIWRSEQLEDLRKRFATATGKTKSPNEVVLGGSITGRQLMHQSVANSGVIE